MPLPKPNNLDIVEEILRVDYENSAKQTARLKKMLDNFLAERGRGEDDNIPVPRQDEYRGRRAVDALEAYLRARRGMKVPLSTAVEHLLIGGAFPGKPRRGNNNPAKLLAQNLKITLPNRTETFAWSPEGLLKGRGTENITVWLAASADEPNIRERSKKKRTKRS